MTEKLGTYICSHVETLEIIGEHSLVSSDFYVYRIPTIPSLVKSLGFVTIVDTAAVIRRSVN